MSEEIIIEMVDSSGDLKDCTNCGHPAHCGYEINYFKMNENGVLSEESSTCTTCQCEDCTASN
jgi:hypothetical protein